MRIKLRIYFPFHFYSQHTPPNVSASGLEARQQGEPRTRLTTHSRSELPFFQISKREIQRLVASFSPPRLTNSSKTPRKGAEGDEVKEDQLFLKCFKTDFQHFPSFLLKPSRPSSHVRKPTEKEHSRLSITQHLLTYSKNHNTRPRIKSTFTDSCSFFSS